MFQKIQMFHAPTTIIDLNGGIWNSWSFKFCFYAYFLFLQRNFFKEISEFFSDFQQAVINI